MLSSRLRKRLRRLWMAGLATVSLLAIALAALMALGQLLLPLTARHPDLVASLLSERLQQPVHFQSMHGYWQASGPVLELKGVTIGQRDGHPALTVPAAVVNVDFGALFQPSRHWVNLRLVDLQLRIRRDPDRQWHLAGFAGGPPVKLADLPGNLWLDHLQVRIEDRVEKRAYRFVVQTLRINNSAGVLRFAGRLDRGTSGTVLKVAGQVSDGGADGRLYLGSQQSDLGRLLAGVVVSGEHMLQGQGSLQLWMEWRQRLVTRVTLDADVRNLAMQGPSGTTSVPALQGLLRYSRNGNQATVLVAPAQSGALRVDVRGLGGDPEVFARAVDFDTAGWLSLAAWTPGMPAGLVQWLASARPHVHLDRAQLHWSQSAGLRNLQARFDQLQFAATQHAPGITPMRGQVHGDAEAVVIQLPAQPMTLDVAGVFRHPIALTRLQGDLLIWPDEQGWTVASDALDVQGKGLAAQFRGQVILPRQGGKPILHVFARLHHGDMAVAHQFWPVNVIPAAAVAWMDRALRVGTLEQASMVMHGDMRDWPFDHHQGHFQADADIRDMDMDYHQGWPPVHAVSGTARFINKGMQVEATSGRVRGATASRIAARIDDFAHAVLVLQIRGQGQGNDMLDFLRNSPLGKPHAQALAGLMLGGGTHFDFTTEIPIAEDTTQAFTLGGQVTLEDATLADADWNLQLTRLRGTLELNDHGFEGQDLSGQMHGQPVRLAVAVGGNAEHPDWPVQVSLRGRFSVRQLTSDYPVLDPLVDKIHGSAPFDLAFHVDDSANNPIGARQLLAIRSNLRGVRLDLPAPLGKPAADAWPLQVLLGVPLDGSPLQVTLGHQVRVRARLATPARPLGVAIQLGTDGPELAVPDQGVRIQGRAKRLDLSGWLQDAYATHAGEPLPDQPVRMDVHAENAYIFGSDFKDMRIRLEPNPEQWELTVSGPDMQGSLTVPRQDIGQRGIVARYQRLYWPAADATTATAAAVATTTNPALASTAATAAVPVLGEAELPYAFGVAPSSLPPLHLWVADLRLGAAHLGQARLESWPTAKGMHIDMLRTQSDSVHMSASGDWNGSATKSHTHLRIDFSAQNLGKMLDALGFQGMFTGGTTEAHLDASWPGGPTSFALANLVGTMQVNIGRGRIPDLKPGVGRLFGLMSIAEVPRRLTKDFGNVFGEGFGFDSITGHFRFEDGNAWTRDFTIKGPAADMVVAGRVDLRQRTYDQYVLAVPHIGNSLPIVGAVLAGPIGAAAGWAMQGLVGKGLDKVASASYHITGPWSQPKVTLLEKHIPEGVGLPASGASAGKTLPAQATSAPAPATSPTAPAHATSRSSAASVPTFVPTPARPASVSRPAGTGSAAGV